MDNTDIIVSQKQTLILDFKNVIRTIEEAEEMYSQLQNVQNQITKEKANVTLKLEALSWWIGWTWVVAAIVVWYNWGLLWAIGVAVVTRWILVKIDKFKNGEKRKAEADSYYNEHVVPLISLKDEVSAKITEFVNSESYNFATQFLAEEYFDSVTAKEICGYLEKGRADSMKEAINLFESVQHERRVEEMQLQQTLAAQEALQTQKETAQAIKLQNVQLAEQNAYARQTEKNTRKAAAELRRMRKS